MAKKTSTKKINTDDSRIRLNKFLSQHGVLSRRQADAYIEQGRIKVSGKVIKEQGYKISVDERKIDIDDVPVEIEKQKHKYYLFYKPKNVISSLSDPERRPCIGDYIQDYDVKLVPAGRLDYDAEGLMLLSNDGEFVHQMMHPSFGKKKTYEVKVKGSPSTDQMMLLKKGIRLEDGIAKAHAIKFLKKAKTNSWYEMVLTDGRNHQIKRMWLKFGHHVLKIIRTQFSVFKIDKMKPGQFIEIKYSAAQTLMQKK